MSETMYTVQGITCEHCVSVVTAELTKLTGVTQVDVDLATGRVRLVSDRSVNDKAVRAAVREAGYEVVS